MSTTASQTQSREEASSRPGSRVGSVKSVGFSTTNSKSSQRGFSSSKNPTESKHRPWLETRNSTVKDVQAAARNCQWVGETSSKLREAIKVMETENSMMEEVLSEPHHIVSNNDLALIMKSVLTAASDSKTSAILQGRKPPVLRSVARAKGEKVPADRAGTEYLPFASSSVPYAALQQEQRDLIQRNKERHSSYIKLVQDVERQQQQLQDRWGKM